MASADTGGSAERPGSSSRDLEEDMRLLNFPPDIDWSTTLVLRCDPEGGPYKLADVASALHFTVRRNEVHNLGPTPLSHAFTLSFKTERSLDNFLRFLKDRRNGKPLLVKNHACQVARIPARTVTVSVRWIPADVDTSCIAEAIQQYGTIVRTDLARNDRNGWFHVYTGERKFHILLRDGLGVEGLPFSIRVKGLLAAVHVAERNPKCLDCYYTGHQSNAYCQYEGCSLYRKA